MSCDNRFKIGFIGGDSRQIYCAMHLSKMGYETALFGFDKAQEDFGTSTKCVNYTDALNNARVVVLGLPATTDNVNVSMPQSSFQLTIEEVFSGISRDTLVVGGNIGNSMHLIAKKYGIKLIDYYEREELQIANACLTSQSAVSLAVNEMDVSITEKPVLVIGYGRIGKTLCYILKAMGCEVYASARKKKDIAWIRAFGYSAVDTSKVEDVISSCRVIFNTVPGCVLDCDKLKSVNHDSLIIDLASKPGGVDFEAAKQSGIKVMWALALPGKKMKKSAGRVVAETILNIFEDEGEIL